MQAMAAFKSQEETITYANWMSRAWKKEKFAPNVQHTWEEVGGEFQSRFRRLPGTSVPPVLINRNVVQDPQEKVEALAKAFPEF